MSLSSSLPVVVAASAVFDSPAPVNAHEVARRLARRGHRVLFVESTGLRAPALGARADRGRVLRRLAGFAQGVRQVEPGLFVLAPLALPAAGPRWLRRVSRRALAQQVVRATRRLEIERPLLWAFLPTALAFASALGPRFLLYQCVDHYAANPGVDAAWLEALERRLVARADLVVATSAVLAERLRRERDDVVLSPNGADVTLFARAQQEPLAEPGALRAIPRPRALYVGNRAGYRVDYALLRGLLRARPALQLILLGPRGLGDVAGAGDPEAGLLQEPRVHAFGPVPHAELPAWMRHADAALIPFLENDHTRGSLPLKLWEYLAAGLPVVASDLPNLREHAEPGVLWLARGSDGFAAAVDRALTPDPGGPQRRLDRARRFDWPERMETLLSLVAARLGELGDGSDPAGAAPSREGRPRG